LGPLAPGTIALIGIGVVLTGVLLFIVFGRSSPPSEPERLRAGPPPTPSQSAEAVAKGLTELESQIHAAVAAEDFKKALDCLAQASDRYEDPQWTRVVNQRKSEAEKTAASLYATVNQGAIEAQTRLDIPELEKTRARIARWGVGKFLSDFDRSFDIAGLK
jgi:hypothetical protein